MDAVTLTLFHSLFQRDTFGSAEVLSRAFRCRCTVTFVVDVIEKGEVILSLQGDAIAFMFPEDKGGGFWSRVIATRLLAYPPIFKPPHMAEGDFLLDLGDGCDKPCLALSSSSRLATLVPDSQYLSSEAYTEQRLVFAAQPSWTDRSDKLFWRGSTTGIRADEADVLTLPRIALCILAKNHEAYDCCIAGSQSLHQISDDEKRLVTSYSIVGSEEHWSSFVRFRYHVDIDGNTNSWSGLFWKLLSGGVVLKVRSNFSQWYYEQLIDGVHFVQVQEDLSDLNAKYEWCLNNPIEAERIARNGRALALSLTFAGEVVKARKKLVAQSLS